MKMITILKSYHCKHLPFLSVAIRLPNTCPNTKNTRSCSDLAQSFNYIKKTQTKQLFSSKTAGLFLIPELKTHSGFQILKKRALDHSQQLVREAISEERKRKMVQIFDELSNSLCQVADLCEFIKIGHPINEFAIEAEKTSAAISAEVERLNTCRPLYDALKKVVTDGDILPTDEIDDRVLKLFLFDMEQSGIHLSEKDRQLVVQINENIFHYGQKFVQNSVQPVYIRENNLPNQAKTYFNKVNEEYIEIDNLHSHSNLELIREIAYRVYLNDDPEQENVLLSLLEQRRLLAFLCGFKTYAERVLKGSIANSPEMVRLFLDILAQKIEPLAKKDYEEMTKMKEIELKSNQVQLKAWDVQHFTAMKKLKYQNSAISDCLPYFSIGTCIEGINLLCQQLYGIRFQVLPTENGELWCDDVVKIGVFEQQQLLGHIYCDLFDRQGKSQQDCHFTIQGSCQRADGTYQNSIVVLFLSLPKSRHSNEPCLLSPSMVDNLFHEMGHAIHSMLARTRYQHVTGTRCSTDLAEVPSILMEYFASDKRVVKQFARHHKTNEPIPDKLLDLWINSKKIFGASEIQLQVFYSILDQLYHGEKSSKLHSLQLVLKLTQNKYYGLKYIEKTGWNLRFAHLYGYGGKYYSYLMSRAIARLIWDKLFDADPLNKTSGLEYRHKLLAHGGGVPPKKLVEDVLETAIEPEMLADAILKDFN